MIVANFTKVIRILLGLFLCILVIKSKAQIAAGDSVFLNYHFLESPFISYWNKPGKWFTNQEVTSIDNLYEQIRENYKFQGTEFVNCFSKIQITTDMEYEDSINTTWNNFEAANNVVLYGIEKPFVKVGFTLNGKSAYSYAVLDSATNSTNCKNAFVIIPGSGANMMTEMIQGNGYHNVNCYATNYLKQFGDVYSTNMANEDHRAIFFNKKKLASLMPQQPTLLQSYLNAIGRPLGINRLIELTALVKHLKAKYDKVFVMGLSTGGKVALWLTMEAEPHATIVSSGYSILVDNHGPTQLVNTYSYGDYLVQYDKDSTKSRLSQLKTQILYTQANGDNAIAQLEVDSNVTQKFFTGLNNISYFYNYNSHAFPPCYAIDSFFTRSMNMASCKVSIDTISCKQDSARLSISFCGQGPFNYTLFKDNQILATYTNRPAMDTISLFSAGLYHIDSIKDALNKPGFRSDTIRFVPHDPISFNYQESNYLCNNAHAEFHIVTGGTSPWKLNYNINGFTDSLTLVQNSSTWLPQNGDYIFNKITDGHNCTLVLNDTLSLQYDTLKVAMSLPLYNCDSNKTHIRFDLEGNAPWTITYIKDSQPIQLQTSLPTTDLYLSNGQYQFSTVADSKGCLEMIGSSFIVNSNPLAVNLVSANYDCDSNKYKVVLGLDGNAPWIIQYTDGVSVFNKSVTNFVENLYLPNGQWTINSVTDATGCVKNLGWNFTVNYSPLVVAVTSPFYNCDSNKVQVNIDVQGNVPWHVSSLNVNLGLQSAKTFYDTLGSLFLGNGLHQVQTVTDATGCESDISLPVSNNYNVLQTQKISSNYDCDSNKVKVVYAFQGDGPFISELYNVQTNTSSFITSSTNQKEFYLPSGSYVFRKASDQKCEIIINDSLEVNFPALQAIMTDPIVSCADKKFATTLYVSSGLFPVSFDYVYDGTAQNMVLNQPISQLTLPNGNYFFNQFKDSVGCTQSINKQFDLTYSPLDFSSFSTSYNCEKDSTLLRLIYNGEDSMSMILSRVGIAKDTILITSKDFYLSNGQYTLHGILDKYGCVYPINQTFKIENSPLDLRMDSIHSLCDTKEFEIIHSGTGKYPFWLRLIHNNTLDSIQISSATDYIRLKSGEYRLINISDSNDCYLNVDTILHLKSFASIQPELKSDYKSLYLQPNLLKHRWFLNNVLFDSISQSTIPVIGEGKYLVVVTDSAGCEYPSNELLLSFPSEVNLYPNPAKDEFRLLINTSYNNSWTYTIHDMAGKLVESGSSLTPLKIVQCSNLAKGVYSIKVSYSNQSGKYTSVLRFEKL